jgi:hypothetical protein
LQTQILITAHNQYQNKKKNNEQEEEQEKSMENEITVKK